MFFTLIYFLVSSESLGLVKSCPASLNDILGTVQHGNYCYTLHGYNNFTKRITWNKANDFCGTLGGELMKVSTEEIATLTTEDPLLNSYSGYWIGARKEDRVWRWRDGEEVEYNNWGLFGGRQARFWFSTAETNCATQEKAMDTWTDWKPQWFKTDCEEKREFACQVEMVFETEGPMTALPNASINRTKKDFTRAVREIGEMRDSRPQGIPESTSVAYSTSSCARKCLKMSDCSMFAYRGTVKECKIYAKTKETTLTEYSPGWSTWEVYMKDR